MRVLSAPPSPLFLYLSVLKAGKIYKGLAASWKPADFDDASGNDVTVNNRKLSFEIRRRGIWCMVGNCEVASEEKWQRFISKWRQSRRQREKKETVTFKKKSCLIFLVFVSRTGLSAFPLDFPQIAQEKKKKRFLCKAEALSETLGCCFNKCADLSVDKPILKAHQRTSDEFRCFSGRGAEKPPKQTGGVVYTLRQTSQIQQSKHFVVTLGNYLWQFFVIFFFVWFSCISKATKLHRRAQKQGFNRCDEFPPCASLFDTMDFPWGRSRHHWLISLFLRPFVRNTPELRSWTAAWNSHFFFTSEPVEKRSLLEVAPMQDLKVLPVSVQLVKLFFHMNNLPCSPLGSRFKRDVAVISLMTAEDSDPLRLKVQTRCSGLSAA